MGVFLYPVPASLIKVPEGLLFDHIAGLVKI